MNTYMAVAIAVLIHLVLGALLVFCYSSRYDSNSGTGVSAVDAPKVFEATLSKESQQWQESRSPQELALKDSREVSPNYAQTSNAVLPSVKVTAPKESHPVQERTLPNPEIGLKDAPKGEIGKTSQLYTQSSKAEDDGLNIEDDNVIDGKDLDNQLFLNVANPDQTLSAAKELGMVLCILSDNGDYIVNNQNGQPILGQRCNYSRFRALSQSIPEYSRILGILTSRYYLTKPVLALGYPENVQQKFEQIKQEFCTEHNIGFSKVKRFLGEYYRTDKGTWDVKVVRAVMKSGEKIGY